MYAGGHLIFLGRIANVKETMKSISSITQVSKVRGNARISLPFFVFLRGSSYIRCLETCQGPDNPRRCPPVIAEEYIQTLVRQSLRTGRAGMSVKSAARFK